jgi:hypothetical protein
MRPLVFIVFPLSSGVCRFLLRVAGLLIPVLYRGAWHIKFDEAFAQGCETIIDEIITERLPWPFIGRRCSSSSSNTYVDHTHVVATFQD